MTAITAFYEISNTPEELRKVEWIVSREPDADFLREILNLPRTEPIAEVVQMPVHVPPEQWCEKHKYRKRSRADYPTSYVCNKCKSETRRRNAATSRHI